MSGHTSSYLTVARVAELLSISELTVRRKIATGEIPAVKLSTIGRGAVRIPADGLETWLRSRRSSARGAGTRPSVRRPSNSPEAA